MYCQGINEYIKKRREDKRIKKRIFLFIIIIITLFLLNFLKVWQNAQFIRIGYEYSKVKQEKEELENINRELKSEIAQLLSSQRIKNLASHLGFKMSSSEDLVVFVLPDDKLKEEEEYKLAYLKKQKIREGEEDIWAMSKEMR